MKPNKTNYNFFRPPGRTILFLCVVSLCLTNSYAQELSIVDLEGDWEVNSTWNASGNWDMGTVPTTAITPAVTIQGDIFSQVSLDFSHNNFGTGLTILANDTLTIFGDLTFTGADMILDIQTNGVLKVLGNLDTNGSDVDIRGDGVIVITGDLTIDGGSFYSDISPPDDLYVDGVINGDSDGNGKDFDDGTTDDLESNHTVLYNEIQVEQPIVLLNFGAAATESDVQLNWATASEENFDYFEVQRSNDGLDYNTLDQVKGHGNSTEVIEYHYSDKLVGIGTYYYRLSAVDYDGSFEVFESTRVDLSGVDQMMMVYPNPLVQGDSRLKIDFNKGYSPDHLVIFDASGRIIFQDIFVERLNSWELNKNLPKGMYNIRVLTSNQILTKKLLVN